MNNICFTIFTFQLEMFACRYNYLSEMRLDEILLQQHNQRRRDLGLEAVEEIEDDEDIRHRWTLFQYQLDSEEYHKAEREITS